MGVGTIIFFGVAITLFILPFLYWAILNGSDKIANGVKYKWRTIFYLILICWPLSGLVIVISFLLFGPDISEIPETAILLSNIAFGGVFI